MLIDPFTIAAQVVNFLILVWLLKRFLYRPILGAMDERERRVAAAMEEADARTAAAEKERTEYEGKAREMEERRERMLEDARKSADEARRQLMHEAREEVARLEAQWRASLDGARDAFHRELAARVQAEVLAIARQTLAELSGPGFEERMAELFVARLGALDPTEKARLAEEAGRADARLTIRSAFELPPAVRKALAAAVKEQIPAGGSVGFDVAPEVVGGIELAVDGQRVSWTIAAHLDSLGRILDETLAGGEERHHRG